ncbi:MAG: leucyl aminopeptidase [Acidimicrobiales bacterium]|nr:leucyl aminopeptidase [Acidimicrobiales bacterium]
MARGRVIANAIGWLMSGDRVLTESGTAITFRVERSGEPEATVRVTWVPSDDLERLSSFGLDGSAMSARGFRGQPDEVLVVPGCAGSEGRELVVAGLGPSDEIAPRVIRRAAAAVGRAVRRHRVVEIDPLPPGTGGSANRPSSHQARALQALAEGIVLGTYRFRRYKTDDDDRRLAEVVVRGRGVGAARALEVGARLAAATNFARDLTNEPGGSLTPERFAEIACDHAVRHGCSVEVFDEVRIAELGLGGLLAVSRGSEQPPRLVVIRHDPQGARARLALVGKGVTFDSGGLSLKNREGMMHMKADMAGAAAVLAAVSLVPAVAPRLGTSAYLPLTDNMTGGDATRPGDIFRARNGKTVEVLNTDAEGRLILADALALASEDRPDAILDLATLTGAIESALGSRIAGLFATHDGLADEVLAAADRAGERVWRMPLPLEYRKRIESDVADLRNIGCTADGGAITAALFLREFVASGIPWAHLDIAGTAWTDSDDGELVKGATGFGVRTLVELMTVFSRRTVRGQPTDWWS